MLVTLMNLGKEEGIKILKYDMCIWLAYRWVNKEKVKVRNNIGNPSFQGETRYLNPHGQKIKGKEVRF